ncbi:RHS repeat-associated core domain-containing protein [Pseudomonas abietaniphila]|uniref:RHS repeat-associated core domain-containing protein n=1 Tax=Pseudomonas abietaniphila TaxID=89065 RepID=A0A1G8NAF0_9PSED|nr:RHS repeat-associated core domain-containing protein [Pseudomonas abietaniphila]SDI76510.1 RHS repeat-associated core domain-containing protein [Pseudomonas abietaniphila]
MTDGAGQSLAQYRYDGHNQLISVLHRQQPETLRFYQDSQLSNSLQAGEAISYLLESGRPLGQQTPGDSSQTLLLMTDATRSVIGECQQKTTRHVTYDPYGEQTGDEPLQSLMAFNGEVRDAIGGWYLLGKGYRAYNPTLMRFHSPDSLSPFGAGGVNPYVYCLSDPINAVDPSGHSLKSWIGVGLGAIGIVATLVTAGGLTPVTGGVIAWGIWAAGVGTAVGGGVTGIMGAMEEDSQHARSLNNISLISSSLSIVFSIFAAAANFSRAGTLYGVSKAAKEGADDAAFSTSKSAGNVELEWDSLDFSPRASVSSVSSVSSVNSVNSTRSAASVSADELTQRLTDLRGYDSISKADKAVQTSASSTRTGSSASLSSVRSVQQPTSAPGAPVSPPTPPTNPVASAKTAPSTAAGQNYTAFRGVVPRVDNQKGLIDQVGSARAPNAHKFLPR